MDADSGRTALGIWLPGRDGNVTLRGIPGTCRSPPHSPRDSWRALGHLVAPSRPAACCAVPAPDPWVSPAAGKALSLT